MPFPRYVNKLIASFRGLPEDKSIIYSNPPVQIHTLVSKLLQKYNSQQSHITDILVKNWKDIVSPQYAHRCTVQRIVANNQLFIRVENPIVRSELEFNKRRILKKIQSLDHCHQFIDISFL